MTCGRETPSWGVVTDLARRQSCHCSSVPVGYDWGVPRTVTLVATCLLGWGTSTAPGGLLAQEPERVSGAVSCDECTITMDTIASIGGLEGPGLGVVSEYSVVSVDRRGRFLVSDVQQNELAVFDAAGEFIRTVGRRGEGPGEYSLRISQVVVGPEYVHVFEFHGGRTLLDHDFNVVSTHRFPGQFLHGYAYVTDSEDVVLMADVPTPDGIGHNFHVLNLSGEMVSFGGNRARSFHVTGDSETMWALEGTVNRVVRWELGAEPRVTRVFERVVDAFDRGPRGSWPGTASGGIALDEDGHLWIRWFTPEPEWTQPQARRLQGRRPPLQRVFDNYLDVVDPQTGLTLARYRSDEVVKFVNGFGQASPYVYAIDQSDAGVVYLHLMKPRLEVARQAQEPTVRERGTSPGSVTRMATGTDSRFRPLPPRSPFGCE